MGRKISSKRKEPISRDSLQTYRRSYINPYPGTLGFEKKCRPEKRTFLRCPEKNPFLSSILPYRGKIFPRPQKSRKRPPSQGEGKGTGLGGSKSSKLLSMAFQRILGRKGAPIGRIVNLEKRKPLNASLVELLRRGTLAKSTWGTSVRQLPRGK